jgi:hypothetical protein
MVDIFFKISKADKISICLQRTYTFISGLSLSKNTHRLLLIIRHPKIRAPINTIIKNPTIVEWNITTECTEARGWSAFESVKPHYLLKLVFAVISMFSLFTSSNPPQHLLPVKLSVLIYGGRLKRMILRPSPKSFSMFSSTTPLNFNVDDFSAEPVIEYGESHASAVPP